MFADRHGAVFFRRDQQKLFAESDLPGNDFLSQVCVQWENSYKPFVSAGIRTSIIRTGLVLSREAGFFPRVAGLSRFGLQPIFGNGKQPFPWIHIADIVGIYRKALFDRGMDGVYNGVCGEDMTYGSWIRKLARHSTRLSLFFPLPEFALTLFLGERARMLCRGQKVSAQKLRKTGFQFKFPETQKALEDLCL